MPLAIDDRPSRLAMLSRRLAIFAGQVLLLALVLHRFAGLPTPVLINTIKATVAAGALSLLMAIGGGMRIWSRGYAGGSAAIAGAIVAVGLIAWPAPFVAMSLRLPALNDVSTDPDNPPAFVEAGKQRNTGANALAYAGTRAAALQATHYADIKPMIVTRGTPESFEITREVLRRLMKWTIIAERPPTGPGGIAEIEAVDHTLVMGYRDDIVIRLKPERDKTRVDIRSASRHGTHDLGRNAERVRALMKELHTRLDLGVPIAPERIARNRQVRQKLLQAYGQVKGGPLQKQPGQAQQGAQRERVQKVSPRSRDEGRDRDKRRRQSWE